MVGRRGWKEGKGVGEKGEGVGVVGRWEGVEVGVGRGLLTLTLSPCAANTGTN